MSDVAWTFSTPGKLLADKMITLQAGKLKFFGTRPNWAVSYIAYTKFHLPRPVYTRPAIFSLALAIGRALVSQPALQWRHNENNGISNQHRLNCLFKCLFRRRSKKTSKLRITGLCEGNSPVTGKFPAQRASNEKNIFIWWRHHVFCCRWGTGSERAVWSFALSLVVFTLDMLQYHNMEYCQPSWINKELSMYVSGELFMRSREGYFGVYFPELRSNEGNKHQNNTRVSV